MTIHFLKLLFSQLNSQVLKKPQTWSRCGKTTWSLVSTIINKLAFEFIKQKELKYVYIFRICNGMSQLETFLLRSPLQIASWTAPLRMWFVTMTNMLFNPFNVHQFEQWKVCWNSRIAQMCKYKSQEKKFVNFENKLLEINDSQKIQQSQWQS